MIFRKINIFILIFILLAFGARSYRQKKAASDFYFLTRTAPLFYAPFLDAQDFDFERYRGYERRFLFREFLEFFSQKTGREVQVIPYHFLNSLVTSSKITEEFLNAPTSENAKRLLDSYDVSADFYETDLRQLSDVWGELLVRDWLSDLTFNSPFQRSVPISTFVQDLALMGKNAQALKAEIAYRRKVLDGKAGVRRGQYVKKMTGQQQNFDRQDRQRDQGITIFSPQEARMIYGLHNKIGVEKDEDEEDWEDGLIDGVPERIQDDYVYPGFTEQDLTALEIRGPYRIPLACFPNGEQHWVYGFFGKGFVPYPNMLLADGRVWIKFFDFNGRTLVEVGEESINVLAFCTCQFIEKDNIFWYVIDAMKMMLEKNGGRINIRDLEGLRPGMTATALAYISEAEERFLKEPSYDAVLSLADVYRRAYHDLWKGNAMTDGASVELEKLWRYGQFIRSRFSVLPKVFDMFYTNIRLGTESVYDIQGEVKPQPDDVISLLFRFSLAELFFMPWSETVWVLDQDPQYYTTPGSYPDKITEASPIYFKPAGDGGL
jgi:hypothetical protein